MTTPLTGTAVCGTTSPAQQYLVISAGLDNNQDGVIDEGGKLLAFPLTPIEGVTADMILKLLGVTTHEIHGEFPITLPAYRLNIFGLIIKDKPTVKTFEVSVQIVDAAGLQQITSASTVHVTL